MGNISDILGGAIKRQTIHEGSLSDQISDAMTNAGIDPPDVIVVDGSLHRFNVGQKRDRSGWYIIYDGEPSAGVFGDWRTGLEQKFVQKLDRELTMVEQMENSRKIAEAKKARDIAKAKSREVASDAVSKIWEGASLANVDHPYLKLKGIGAHGARVTGDGRLVLPLYTPEGSLSSLQYIGDEKRFHGGGKAEGCLHMIGPSDSHRAYLVEGFADAATVFEETGSPCYIAYSGSNMVKVAEQIKLMGSHGEIIVVGDNDNHGKGQEWAEKAAKIIGAQCIVPPVEGDINDFRANGGNVVDLIVPKVEDAWFVQADDFCAQPAPIEWVIKGWLQANSLMMVHGPSGGGKTFLILDMALRVAGGIDDWWGHKVKCGPVVYLAGEGHHGLRGRIAGWKQAHGVESLDLILSKGGCDLNSPDGYLKVSNGLKSLKYAPKLIIVDTLHRFLAGDENSAVDAKTMLDACAGLMEEFGCAVILVHHTGVNEAAQDRARGSSAWRGALDIEINIKPANKEKGDPMEVRQMKSKDAELSETLAFDLKGVPIDGWLDEDGEQVTTAILEKGVSMESGDKGKPNLKKHLKVLENAWLESDRKWTKDGRHAILDRDCLKSYLIENEGFNEQSVRQILKPSARGKIVNSLIDAGAIEIIGEGYIIVERGLLSIFRIVT